MTASPNECAEAAAGCASCFDVESRALVLAVWSHAMKQILTSWDGEVCEDAENPAMTLQLAVQSQWRRVSDPCRSPPCERSEPA
jgi:hypothetical protein